MATPVIQSGNYLLEIDTGWDSGSFRLDDATKGVLAGYTISTTRTNLLPDPSCENASVATYWQAIAITESRSSDYAYSGTYSLKGVIDNAALSQYFQVLQTAGAMIDVTAGQTYTFSAYIYLPSTNTADSTWRAQLYFWNGTGYTSAFSGTTTTITRGNWTRLSVSATVPSGYYKALPRILSTTFLAVGQVAYVDAWLLETGSTLLPYFDGTYADTYTGYTLTSQQWNSTANASTSTATWGLTSSYTTSNYPLGPTTSYEDVTDGVLNVRIFRGRKDIGDQFTPGTMSFTLDDSIAYGAFNPFNQDSPTYDPANDQPGIAPLRRVRFYRLDSSNNAESLFQGFIVDFDYQFTMDGKDTVTIGCVDDQYLLSQAILDEWNVNEELSSVRVTSMLALPEVDAFQGVGQQSIETGTATLGGAAAYTVPQGTIAQAYLQDILDAEQGRAFVDRSGVFTYQARIGATLSNPTVSFSDNNGLTVPYQGLGINFGADKVVNRATVTILVNPNSPQTAEDLASQAEYFIQATSIGDSLLHNDTAALDLANYLLAPQPSAVFTDVQVEFQALTAAQRDDVAILDIGQTVSVEKTIVTGVSSTSVIAQESAIEGIEHQISYSQPHRVTIYTSPTVVLQAFILDSSTLDSIYALT